MTPTPSPPAERIIEDVDISVHRDSWGYKVKTSTRTRITWHLYDINKNRVHTSKKPRDWSTKHDGTFGGYIPSGKDGYVHLKAVSRGGKVEWWPSKDKMYKMERQKSPMSDTSKQRLKGSKKAFFGILALALAINIFIALHTIMAVPLYGELNPIPRMIMNVNPFLLFLLPLIPVSLFWICWKKGHRNLIFPAIYLCMMFVDLSTHIPVLLGI